jgi:hypothetical protein
MCQLERFDRFANHKRSLVEDRGHITHMLVMAIKEHVVLVAEDGVDLLGTIGGIFSGHPYNLNIKVLTETFWWVDPKFRGSKAALMLLNDFERIGRERSDWIVMTTRDNSQVKSKHLLKRGFRACETSYLLEA